MQQDPSEPPHAPEGDEDGHDDSPLLIGGEATGEAASASSHEAICTPEERAMQGWMRVVLRVLSVTMAGAGPPAECEPPAAPCPPYPLREGQGHAHICLGELMEESVTWIEVPWEDDVNSPKQCDQVQAMEEEEEGAATEVPAAMKDIYRQQKAPGIVAGMQKCLSF